MNPNLERTFIAIKPDGVQRGLIHVVIQRFENRGFKLVAMKTVLASNELLKQHYAEHEGKSFLSGLIDFMKSGPIVAMVWEGANVIAEARRLIGATNPLNSAMGTLRGDFCVHVGRNLVHGSDGELSAQREISLWFTHSELLDWTLTANKWLYE